MDKLTLNKTQADKWYHNLILFLAPVAVIYLGAVAFTLQSENHVFSLNDFIPSTFTLGAMALYIVNTLLDYVRKLK